MIDVDTAKAQEVFLKVLKRIQSGEMRLEHFEAFARLSSRELQELIPAPLPKFKRNEI